MLAYFAPGVRVRGPARDIPAFARILVAGPWQTKGTLRLDGEAGTIAWNGTEPLTDDLIDNLFRTGQWRDCEDGLQYRQPPTLPTQAELARANCPQGIDVLMSTGVQLTIPLALAAPRKISFAKSGLGQPATAFGVVAHRLSERLASLPASQSISLTDPDVLGTITEALSAAYRGTAELFDDLGWVTSADIEAIISAVMGSDPKASAPAPSTSPSPAVGSGKSP